MPEKVLGQVIPKQVLAERLSSGLDTLAQDAAAHPIARYLDYLQLLVKWNRAYNLSGIRQPHKILSHHILDSLSALPYLQGHRCLDVGTGAGLPGFILALADADREWVLLDSNSKKVRFLRQAVLELQPGNVEVVEARVEDFRPQTGFTSIISRAMSPFIDLRRTVAHLSRPDNTLIAMKGELTEAEKRLATAEADRIRLETLQVPGVAASRNLLIQTGLTMA